MVKIIGLIWAVSISLIVIGCDSGATDGGESGGQELMWLGELDTIPAEPEQNWAYFNRVDKVSYIWTGVEWDTLAVSGMDGLTGETGVAGSSIIWKGDLPEAPATPEENWAYYNTEVNKSFIYNGTEWATLASGVNDGYIPSVQFITPDGVNVVVGGALTLTVRAIDDQIDTIATPNQYIWSFDGVTFSDTTESGEVSHAFTTLGSHDVWVKAISRFGDVSTAAGIVVNVLPKASYITAGDYSSYIILEDASLWAAGEGYFGDGAYSEYQITFKNSGQTGQGISAGYDHQMLLKDDATLWVIGENGYGEAGDSIFYDKNYYAQVATNVVSVATGSGYSVYLKGDGTVWASGYNSYGQFGNGTNTDTTTFIQVATGVASISTGYAHTAIVKTDGTLWVAGSNSNGQLGNATVVDTNSFMQVATGVASVSAGDEHTAIIKDDGTLWMTGDNRSGQLGIGTAVDTSTFVEVMSNVASVSAGNENTAIIKSDSTLWIVGGNDEGALGDSTFIDKTSFLKIDSNVVSVSAGDEFTLILKDDGTVWGTGYNSYGQLGDGTYNTLSSFKQIYPLNE